MRIPFQFEHPLVLACLPIAIWLMWRLNLGSRSGLDPLALKRALVLRLGLVSSLILALAQPSLVRLSDRMSTVYVMDVSRSISSIERSSALRFIDAASKAKRPDDTAGLIVFGKDSYLEEPLTTQFSLAAYHAAVDPDGTDIESALRAASGALASDSPGRRIVLLTDGNENIGSAIQAAPMLKSQGIKVDCVVLGQGASTDAQPEALISGLVLPREAFKGQPFTIRALVETNVAQRATLQFERNGNLIGTREVGLRQGKTAVDITQTEQTAGTYRYDAVLNAASDTEPGNNQYYNYLKVAGSPRILYIADSKTPGSTLLARAMTAQGMHVDIEPPSSVPTDLPSIAAYDSIVLGGAPASEFSPSQLQAIADANHDFGVGLGMVGGPNSYAAGAYIGTPIEAALPVDMNVHKNKHLPAADVVVVLDASGSMSATEGGVEKVQLAARAAINLMRALTPNDRVAVIAVTETPTVMVPLEPPAKAASAEAAISSLEAGGGGIYCRTGLEAAYEMLRSSKAPIKHVIICPDTTDSEQQEGSLQLARDARAEFHITTSVCGIGEWHDQHVPYQRALSQAGGGQLFIVSQAADLPSFFQRDLQAVQQSLFVEKPTLPNVSATDPVIGGLPWTQVGPLLGYNLVARKPGATTPAVAAGTKNPLFAYWRYGVGHTFAFTSDDRPHWAVHWLGWPGYSQFWSRILRWSMSSTKNNDFQASVEQVEGKGHIVVDAFTASGGFVNGAPFVSRIVNPDLTSVLTPLVQTAPGRYEASFDTDQIGAYMVNVFDGKSPANAQMLGFSIPYSPELRDLHPNSALLTQLANASGGAMLADPEKVYDGRTLSLVSSTALFPWLLLLGAFLLVADIAWRRLSHLFGNRFRQPVGFPWDRQVGPAAPSKPAPSKSAIDTLQPLRETMARARRERLSVAQGRSSDDDSSDLLARRLSDRLDTDVDEDPFPFVASVRPKPGEGQESHKPPSNSN